MGKPGRIFCKKDAVQNCYKLQKRSPSIHSGSDHFEKNRSDGEQSIYSADH